MNWFTFDIFLCKDMQTINKNTDYDCDTDTTMSLGTVYFARYLCLL